MTGRGLPRAGGPDPARGGPVAGRAFPGPALALLFALAATTVAPAGDILRLKPTADGITPLSLRADETYSWPETGETVYVLGGSVWVQQDQTEVVAPRAVVWVDTEAVQK